MILLMAQMVWREKIVHCWKKSSREQLQFKQDFFLSNLNGQYKNRFSVLIFLLCFVFLDLGHHVYIMYNVRWHFLEKDKTFQVSTRCMFSGIFCCFVSKASRIWRTNIFMLVQLCKVYRFFFKAISKSQKSKSSDWSINKILLCNP